MKRRIQGERSGVRGRGRLAVGACALGGILGVAGCSAHEPARPTAATAKAVAAQSCSLDGAVTLEPEGRASGTVALARAGGRTHAFVADEDGRRVSVTDLERGEEVAAIEVAAAPGALLIHPSGAVVVTLPQRSELEVLRFDGKGLKKACAVPTALEPVALALAPDARTLFVASAWGHALGAFSASTLAETYRVDLPRDPRAVVVSGDGARAYVSHAVGSTLSTVELAERRVQRTSLDAPLSLAALEQARLSRESFDQALAGQDETRTAELKAMFEEQLKTLLLAERTGNHGYALALSSRAGGRVLIPQVEVDSGRREQRSAGYGSGTQNSVLPSVAVVSTKTLALDPLSVPSTPPWREVGTLSANENCRLPRAAALDEASGTLLVVCLGADVLVGYDAAAPRPIEAETLRVRVASGPTGVALDSAHQRAVVWSQFERTLNVVSLPRPGAALAATDTPVRRIAARPTQTALPELVSLGRRLFHAVDDPRIARDGRACASCHIGGRDDGLVWSTPRGPRRTKLLSGGVHATAPYAWDGAAATLHEQIEGTLERLDGQGGLRAVELDALAAYVTSLSAPPRDSERDAAVERGEKLFASTETGCATCHRGSTLSDGVRHSVSSAAPSDTSFRFDTPSLVNLSGRAPYFHDGRYATLAELLAAKGDAMGHTSHLSAADLAALEAFLTTL